MTICTVIASLVIIFDETKQSINYLPLQIASPTKERCVRNDERKSVIGNLTFSAGRSDL